MKDGKPDKRRRNVSRRTFLGSAAAAGAFTVVPSTVLGANPPSDRLNIAGIGVGGRGFGDLRNMGPENIVALCDVDHNYAARAFNEWPKAKRYKDYRRMLDQQDNIDAVMIATPDHTHAIITMAALKRGKHVYCEKPLTHSVWEARKIAEAAREADVTTQMGIQGHSGEGARLVREWIKAGVIGEVREVDAWSDESYYPPGHAGWSPKIFRRPKKGMPMPNNLDWNLWIGPAHMRPYHEAYHPVCWRAWWEFGTGWTCDRGVHTMDPVVWALDLGVPTAIDARSSLGHNPDTHPVASLITYDFPAANNRPPVTVTWYEGLRPPRPDELEQGRILGSRHGGILFNGTKGKITCGIYAEGPRLLPESRMEDFLKNPPEKTIPRVKTNHQQNWVQACKAGEKAVADFQYGAMVSEVCLLGNVAKWVNDRIKYDPRRMKVTNLPEADRQLRPHWRDGWSL